jgi:hypothetical protein
MYYSYIEIEYVAASFSPAGTDLALKLLILLMDGGIMISCSDVQCARGKCPPPDLLQPALAEIYNRLLRAFSECLILNPPDGWMYPHANHIPGNIAPHLPGVYEVRPLVPGIAHVAIIC